jgi:hypothetical protein
MDVPMELKQDESGFASFGINALPDSIFVAAAVSRLRSWTRTRECITRLASISRNEVIRLQVSRRPWKRNRNRERALLLCLTDNLIDPRPQLKISVIQLVFRRQTGYRRGAARNLLHDSIR